MVRMLAVCVIALMSASMPSFADKKPGSELVWSTKESENCTNHFCVKITEDKWPDMNKKTKVADRMRKTDPFSPHNSDSGDDGVNMSVTYGFD